MEGMIFEIKRFAVHDGDGIRTTVFFKGCPLKCAWCHNPEGISFQPQLAYYAHKCIGCGECVKACPSGAQYIRGGVHVFDRTRCIGCGECSAACIGDALTFYGKKITVEELLPKLLEDREFYLSSGGGVTLSGGECLMQGDFCAQLLQALKKEGIHTAVDTCGYVSQGTLDKVIPFTDVFLYDLKAYDEDVHVRATGCSNKQILENLAYLDAQGKQIEIRIPFVPSYNKDQIEPLARLLSTYRNVTGVRILPYHNYAGSKYGALEMENTLPQELPADTELQKAKQLMQQISGVKVID